MLRMTAIASRMAQAKDFWVKALLFDNEPTPELAAILLAYFVQGIIGLSQLAVSFFLKDDLGLTPAQTSALLGIGILPWMVKPLFGFISDGLPIARYRRRPYLVLVGLLGSGAWLAMATVVQTAWAVTVAILVSGAAIAMSDVIVDSIVVERVRQESQSAAGSLQSLCWSASAWGGLIAAYLGGILLEHVSVRTVFGITAIFPLIVLGASRLIDEDPVDETHNHNIIVHQIQQLWQTIKQRSIWMPALFIFLWQATPSSGSAFFFFVTNDLGFQPEFLGRLNFVTSVAGLLGVWFFQQFLKAVSIHKIIAWSIVISTLLGLSALVLVTHTNRTLGISDQWFSLGDTLVLAVMGKIALMPLLVLAARICPVGIEATLFALLMSVFNGASLVSQEGGAILTHLLGITETNFDQMWLLVLITTLSSLLPLPFLGLLSSSDPPTQPSEAGAKLPSEPEPPTTNPILANPVSRSPIRNASD
ncbi:MAG: folate/biopterin family MFS transporter [Leptolyngbyaceae bacterium]|nr:folate/biopterin family MFS transporter [Leptolyngbyaceae bacterium]